MAEPDRLTTGLVAVLGTHELQWIRPYVAQCSCGSWDSKSDAAEAFKAHLADELVEVVDAYVERSEARLRQRLAKKLQVLARTHERDNPVEAGAYRVAGRTVLKG
jgi:hypothetical protein